MTESVGPAPAPPSVFTRIMEHSKCTCSYCVAMWEIISKMADTMNDETFAQYAEHMQRFHKWVPGEGEA